MRWEDLDADAREPYMLLAQECLSGMLFCTRVWSAWDAGTMTRDDFILANEDEDTVGALAHLIFQFFSDHSAPPEAEPEWIEPDWCEPDWCEPEYTWAPPRRAALPEDII